MYEVTHNIPTGDTIFAPEIDIHENEEGLILSADLPGVSRDNLDVIVDNSVLRIVGRCPNTKPPAGSWVYQEFRSGDYVRSFILSDEVDTARINAHLENGVLTVYLPRSPRSPARKVDVSGG